MLKFPKLRSGFPTIDAQWEKLCTILQKYMEHHPVTNGTLDAMAKGDIVRASGDREVSLALADTSDNAEWVGVLDGVPVVPAGAKTDMATSNVALVRFEDGLTLNEGQPCYLSGTVGGAATTFANLDVANFSIRVGIVVDASDYVTVDNHFAHVLLGRCCAPAEIPQ